MRILLVLLVLCLPLPPKPPPPLVCNDTPEIETLCQPPMITRRGGSPVMIPTTPGEAFT